MNLVIYTDGGARGNPGPSGFGVAVFNDHQELVYKYSQYLGIKTNNEAEYSAILSAVSWLLNTDLSIESVTFCLDSELVVRQLQGRYKVKAPNLLSLFIETKKQLAQLPSTPTFKHIPREQNHLADKLANEAMDRQS